MEFNRLLQHFQRTYYTEIITFGVEVTALICGLLYIRRYLLGRYFIFYIVFDLSVLLFYWFLILKTGIDPELKSRILNISNALISLTELLVYCYFFRLLLLSSRIKKITSLLTITYSFLVFLYLITMFDFLTNRFRYVTYLLGVLEFLILIPPCFAFFHQILKTESKLKLFERPSFWVVTGIFFYVLISIPYYLLDTFIYENGLQSKYLFSALLYQLPFTIHFAFLTKAFLCKKILTI